MVCGFDRFEVRVQTSPENTIEIAVSSKSTAVWPHFECRLSAKLNVVVDAPAWLICEVFHLAAQVSPGGVDRF